MSYENIGVEPQDGIRSVGNRLILEERPEGGEMLAMVNKGGTESSFFVGPDDLRPGEPLWPLPDYIHGPDVFPSHRREAPQTEAGPGPTALSTQVQLENGVK